MVGVGWGRLGLVGVGLARNDKGKTLARNADGMRCKVWAGMGYGGNVLGWEGWVRRYGTAGRVGWWEIPDCCGHLRTVADLGRAGDACLLQQYVLGEDD